VAKRPDLPPISNPRLYEYWRQTQSFSEVARSFPAEAGSRWAVSRLAERERWEERLAAENDAMLAELRKREAKRLGAVLEARADEFEHVLARCIGVGEDMLELFQRRIELLKADPNAFLDMGVKDFKALVELLDYVWKRKDELLKASRASGADDAAGFSLNADINPDNIRKPPAGLTAVR